MKNIEINAKKAEAVVTVNPRVFPLEVVYAACYVLLDKAYFLFDGDPEKEIKITLIAKKEKINSKELEKLAFELHDEFINYATYAVQAARNQGVREAIIKRALATNLGKEFETCACEEDNLLKEKEEEIKIKDEDLFIDDPEGIAKPWTPEKAKGLKKPKSED